MSRLDTRRIYAHGTFIDSGYPLGAIRKARAMCPDGVVRTCKRVASTADTFFSVPATVTVRRKSVAGYITIQTVSGLSTESPEDPWIVRFIPYTYRKNAYLLVEVSK